MHFNSDHSLPIPFMKAATEIEGWGGGGGGSRGGGVGKEGGGGEGGWERRHGMAGFCNR